jgi:HEAT repeat protein
MAARTIRDLRRRHKAGALVTMLAAGRWQDRRDATLALAELEDTKAVPAISGLLADRHPRVRLAAVQALGKLPSPSAADALTTFLEQAIGRSVDDAAHWNGPLVAAAQSLGQLGDSGVTVGPRPRELVLHAYRADSLPLLLLVRCLGVLHDPAGLAPLLELAEQLKVREADDQLKVREADDRETTRRYWQLLRVIEALGELGDQAAREPLRELMESASDERARIGAASSLARLGDRAAIEWLLETVRELGAWAETALRALTSVDRPSAPEHLRGLIESPDLSTRTWAAIALARYEPAVAAPVLRDFNSHPEARVWTGLLTQAELALPDPLEIPLAERARQSGS